MAGGSSVEAAEPDIVGVVVTLDVGEVVGDAVAVGGYRSTSD